MKLKWTFISLSPRSLALNKDLTKSANMALGNIRKRFSKRLSSELNPSNQLPSRSPFSSSVATVAFILLLLRVGTAMEHEGRIIPDMHLYHQEEQSSVVSREYYMHEQDARIKIICPRDYYIAGVKMQLQLSDEYLKNNSPPRALREPFTHHLKWHSESAGEDESHPRLKGISRNPLLPATTLAGKIRFDSKKEKGKANGKTIVNPKIGSKVNGKDKNAKEVAIYNANKISDAKDIINKKDDTGDGYVTNKYNNIRPESTKKCIHKRKRSKRDIGGDDETNKDDNIRARHDKKCIDRGKGNKKGATGAKISNNKDSNDNAGLPLLAKDDNTAKLLLENTKMRHDVGLNIAQAIGPNDVPTGDDGLLAHQDQNDVLFQEEHINIGNGEAAKYVKKRELHNQHYGDADEVILFHKGVNAKINEEKYGGENSDDFCINEDDEQEEDDNNYCNDVNDENDEAYIFDAEQEDLNNITYDFGNEEENTHKLQETKNFFQTGETNDQELDGIFEAVVTNNEGTTQLNNESGTNVYKAKSHCPSMARCLGYVGCLFNIGNEFCLGDVLPGYRKVFNVNITCVHTQHLERPYQVLEGIMKDDPTEAMQEHVLPSHDIKRRSQKVVRLQYRSGADADIPDYAATDISNVEIDVREVLFVRCEREGYLGECGDGEALSHTHVGDALWHVLARTEGPRCRTELLQVYCSYQYNPRGLCWPPYALAPGQVTAVNDSADVLPSFAAYPPLYEKEMSEKSASQAGQSTTKSAVTTKKATRAKRTKISKLNPVKLAFLILVHKDPEAVVQQLQMLYSQQHTFLYHVDRRRSDMRNALIATIQAAYPHATNIRVMDSESSFVPSWGSYGIVRAELQGFRELLEIPEWEYIIKLSGSELPLRSMADLTFTLAPYRGHSLITSFGAKNVRNESNPGLLLDVWHGCGGHVYNVTRAGGVPSHKDLKIHTGSQWSVPHRSLIEYMFSAHRSPVLKRWHYYFSTAIIPDETFSATIVGSSPFINSTLNLMLHWLKKFKNRNALHLCRHTDDTDFCGQGPGIIDDTDWHDLFEVSHRNFFARKFPTDDPNAAIRTKIIEHKSRGYYEGVLQKLSEEVIREIVALSIRRLKLHMKLPSGYQWDGGATYKIRLVPRLEVWDPCCQLAFIFSYKLVQEYAVVLDFYINIGKGRIGARSRLLPQRQFRCYNDGHLRALRVTTWAWGHDLDEASQPPGPPRQLSINLPLPHGAAPVYRIFVELWMHAGNRSVNEQCAKSRAPLAGVPMLFSNLNITAVTAQPITYEAGIEDGKGRVLCYATKEIQWNNSTVHQNKDMQHVETASMVTLPCTEPLSQGLYTLRVTQLHVVGARTYDLPVVVLPEPGTTKSSSKNNNNDNEGSSHNNNQEDKLNDPECPNCGRLNAIKGIESQRPEHGVLFGTWEVEEVGILKATQNGNIREGQPAAEQGPSKEIHSAKFSDEL